MVPRSELDRPASSATSLGVADSVWSPVTTPAALADGVDLPVGEERAQCSSEGADGDLRTNAAVDLGGCGVGIAGQVLEDERLQAVRLDASEGGPSLEPNPTEQARLDVVPRRPGSARRPHQPGLDEPLGPWPQGSGIGQLQRAGKLSRRHPFGLREQPEGNPLALGELVALVGLCHEPHDAGVRYPAR